MTPIRGYFDTDMLSSCRCHDESALFKILLRKGGKSLEKGKKKLIVSRQPIFVNLKSNTMKNTVANIWTSCYKTQQRT